jgi:alpha-galactosidase
MNPLDMIVPLALDFGGNILMLSSSGDASASDFVGDEDSCRWVEACGPHLQRQCVLNIDREHRAAVLRVVISNTSSTEMAEQLNPDVFHMRLRGRGTPYRAFRASGGLADRQYPPENYRTQEVMILGHLVNSSPPGGRSSDRILPISMVADERGAGLWFGMEWSGAWVHRFQGPRWSGSTSVQPDELSIEAWVASARPVLRPGEQLTLPPVHFGFFDHGFDDATNRLRRYLYERVCPALDGRPPLPALTYDHWFGIGNKFDEALLERQLDRAAELGLEYFVLDGGWNHGQFPEGVGNWFPDRTKFPHGIENLSAKVRQRGMKFGLWIEPERAHRSSRWAVEHPEMFIDIGASFLHLNLARRDAQDLVIGFLTELFDRAAVKWTRWDYNIDPMPYWNKADPTGRIQFDYMQGLYRVLDVLMERFGDLLIENCASGGRRLDIGTMRRAHSCWFSDETFSPETCRYMQLNANRFLPGHLCNSSIMAIRGDGDGGLGAYDAISRMAGTLLFGGDIAGWSPELTAIMRRNVALFRQVRPLLVQDYYHLLPSPAHWADWDAGQFVSRDRRESMLLVFRGFDGEGATSRRILLRGLVAEAQYEVTDPHGAVPSVSLSGADLMAGGIEISLTSRQGCVRLLHAR